MPIFHPQLEPEHLAIVLQYISTLDLKNFVYVSVNCLNGTKEVTLNPWPINIGATSISLRQLPTKLLNYFPNLRVMQVDIVTAKNLKAGVLNKLDFIQIIGKPLLGCIRKPLLYPKTDCALVFNSKTYPNVKRMYVENDDFVKISNSLNFYPNLTFVHVSHYSSDSINSSVGRNLANPPLNNREEFVIRKYLERNIHVNLYYYCNDLSIYDNINSLRNSLPFDNLHFTVYSPFVHGLDIVIPNSQNPQDCHNIFFHGFERWNDIYLPTSASLNLSNYTNADLRAFSYLTSFNLYCATPHTLYLPTSLKELSLDGSKMTILNWDELSCLEKIKSHNCDLPENFEKLIVETSTTHGRQLLEDDSTSTSGSSFSDSWEDDLSFISEEDDDDETSESSDFSD